MMFVISWRWKPVYHNDMRNIYIILILLCIILFPAPGFPGTKGPVFRLGERATILIFVASHCPCTDAHRQHVRRLIEQYGGRGVQFYTVFSNSDETSDRIDHFMRGVGWEATPLLDRDGGRMTRYGAKTTPHAFLLDPTGEVRYHGAIDDSVQNMGQIINPYLRTALEQLLTGVMVSPVATTPYGCYIVRGT